MVDQYEKSLLHDETVSFGTSSINQRLCVIWSLTELAIEVMKDYDTDSSGVLQELVAKCKRYKSFMQKEAIKCIDTNRSQDFHHITVLLEEIEVTLNIHEQWKTLYETHGLGDWDKSFWEKHDARPKPIFLMNQEIQNLEEKYESSVKYEPAISLSSESVPSQISCDPPVSFRADENPFPTLTQSFDNGYPAVELESQDFIAIARTFSENLQNDFPSGTQIFKQTSVDKSIKNDSSINDTVSDVMSSNFSEANVQKLQQSPAKESTLLSRNQLLSNSKIVPESSNVLHEKASLDDTIEDEKLGVTMKECFGSGFEQTKKLFRQLSRQNGDQDPPVHDVYDSDVCKNSRNQSTDVSKLLSEAYSKIQSIEQALRQRQITFQMRVESVVNEKLEAYRKSLLADFNNLKKSQLYNEDLIEKYLRSNAKKRGDFLNGRRTVELGSEGDVAMATAKVTEQNDRISKLASTIDETETMLTHVKNQTFEFLRNFGRPSTRSVLQNAISDGYRDPTCVNPDFLFVPTMEEKSWPGTSEVEDIDSHRSDEEMDDNFYEHNLESANENENENSNERLVSSNVSDDPKTTACPKFPGVPPDKNRSSTLNRALASTLPNFFASTGEETVLLNLEKDDNETTDSVSDGKDIVDASSVDHEVQEEIRSQNRNDEPVLPNPIKLPSLHPLQMYKINRLKQMIMSNDDVIYEDDTFQIGVKCSFSNISGEIIVFYGNKTSGLLQNLEVIFLSPGDDSLAFNAAILPSSIKPHEQIRQKISVSCGCPFERIPMMRVQFLLSDNSPRVEDIYFPVVISKFMFGVKLAANEFDTLWKSESYALREVRCCFTLSQRFFRQPRRLIEVCQMGGAMSWQTHVGKDLETIAFAGAFPPKGATVDMSESLVLTKLELDGASKGPVYLTARSDCYNLSLAIRRLLFLLSSEDTD